VTPLDAIPAKRLARLLAAQAAPEPAPPAALLPPSAILDAIRAGELLTTEHIVARMGLVPTVPLQLRVARALREQGFDRLGGRLTGTNGYGYVWIATPADPVSPRMRRIHEAGDRAPELVTTRATDDGPMLMAWLTVAAIGILGAIALAAWGMLA
jgi:hypothetical protein